MIRFLAALVYFFTSQTERESMAFFWKHYENTRSGSGISQKISGCLYHRLLRESLAGVPVETSFAEYPTLPHGLSGINISQGATIGKGCTIFQQVTIGSNMLPDSSGYGAPVIGDDVYIGAGARIIGAVHIGNGVRIGAGCTVCTDIPDYATVVCGKPVIIEHDAPRDNHYKEYSKN